MDSVFTSWSGGKDSCLACYRAISTGLKVRYLVNMLAEDAKRPWTHGLSREVLKMQSQAIGIPLVQRRTTLAGYETDLKDVILTLKKEGIAGGVFGDIDLEVHREWVERVCREAGVAAYLPLWGGAQETILRDFINLGFEAIVVMAKAEFFSEEWLGQKVDLNLLAHLLELGRTKGVTPCGEAGEYHTFVTDGPLFKQRVEIQTANKILRDGCWFLDIVKSELQPK